MELETLYGLSSNGKVKEWKIWVEDIEDASVIYTAHGYIDGKTQTSKRVVKTGKNIGKSNETSRLEQAQLEAKSKWEKKRDSGYTTNLDQLTVSSNEELANRRPMLAHDYKKRGHSILFPCYIQPKLNGVRALAYKRSENDIIIYSRQGKEFSTLDHIKSELNTVLDVGKTLDGEIYIHGRELQDIVSILKCEKENRGREQLEYHVYDMADDSLSYKKRLAHISLFFNQPSKSDSFSNVVKQVETICLTTSESIRAYHDRWVDNGYEGLILRNLEGVYSFNHRCVDLQKYKQFIDEEFTIVDGKEGLGSDEGCVIFRCITKENKEFDVRPRGSKEQRKIWFDKLHLIVGKPLTVRYFNLTPDGIPFHPVGIGIRDYE